MTVDFNDYFWGEKNNGFDVLYHNMKFGLAASRELAEFLRERSSVEEAHAKQLAKLAKQAAAGGMAGGGLVMGGRDAASGGPVAQSTFAPLWLLLRTSADRLSALHLHLVQRMTDLVKEVSRYAEDLHKKHKSVKEDESGTLEAVQAIQASTLHVQKVKDQLTQRTVEVEKLHKDNGSAKELEKAEAKLRKCQDDYRAAVDKYNTVKEDFERKMSQACRHFQVLEESHLGQMKEFVGVYAKLVQHTHDQVGDVHADFRRQCQDLTVEKLLEQFVYAKHTGLEKPTLTELVNDHHHHATLNQQQVSTESTATSAHAQQTLVDNVNSTAATTVSTTKREGFLRSRRDKAKQKKSKKKKDGPDNISNKEDKSDMEEKDDSVKSTPPPSAIGVTVQQAPSSLTSSTASRIDSLDAIAAASAVTNNAACALASGSPPPLLAASGSSGNIATAVTSSSAVEAAAGGGGMSHATSTNTNTGNSTADLVDEDGYTIQPVSPAHAWHTHASSVGSTGVNTASKTAGSFYSSSDSDSDDDRERKIRVEIKPLNNGAGPISASVDELRATVENLSLSPIGRRGSGLDSHGHGHHHHHHHDSHSNNNSIMKRSQSVSQQLGVGNAANVPSAIIPHAVAHLHGKSIAATDLLGLSLHSPAASNASTPTTASHPYTPLQSPSQPPTINSPALSASSRYADLGDLFCEVGELSNTISTTAGSSAAQAVSALSGQNFVGGTATTGRTRQTPTPTSGYMSIPRPPSRRSEAIAAAAAAASNANASTPVSRTLIASPAPIGSGAMARTDSVGSLEFRTAGVLVGVSRGPSPLTIGMMDTIPLAVAFHEIVHSYFRGSDEKRCQVKMSGEMMLSFPAGIVAILANNPNPAKLAIRIRNTQRLNAIVPNKELVSIDNTQSSADCLILEFNMTSLSALLKKQSEQNPSASYFNVDILKYQIKPKVGANSCPFQLVAYWKCDSTHTDLKVDYKYNSHAMNAPSPLLNVIVNVPIEGGVKNTQSKPTAQWLQDSNRIQWKFSELSQHSDNGGIGSLLARVELDEPGSGAPTTISLQFNCEGTTLSGIDFQLVGPGYRLSLVKRRFISGKYICDGDLKYTTATTSSGSGTVTPSSTASTADRHL